MNSRQINPVEFISDYRFWGEWEVCYTDGTHLTNGDYVKLGDIIIDASKEMAHSYPILPFIFRPLAHEQMQCRLSKLCDENKNNQVNRAQKIIRDQLADSLVRTGLLRPEFRLMEEQIVKTEFREVMNKLSEGGYLILVADTGSLRRGAISFLHITLPDVLTWTVVPVFVMTEIQRQVDTLNSIWRKSAKGGRSDLKKCEVLKMRPQVSAVSRELSQIRQWRPLEILTTLSEHLGQSNGVSKIDRLIIESVKNLKRDRGLHKGVYLLTGDKDMASLATLENQRSLHIGVPSLPTQISSLRYDSLNRKLILIPIQNFLWDLTQVFSIIRLTQKDYGRKFELHYYSNARAGFFSHDVIAIQEIE